MCIKRQELAEYTDITRSTMCEIENGKRTIKLPTLKSIANTLQVPAWELLKRAENEL